MAQENKKRVYGEDTGNLDEQAIAEFNDMLQKKSKMGRTICVFRL